MIPRSMVTGKLEALGGWFTRSLPRRLLFPDGLSRARQERGLQSGATKLCSASKLIATKLIGTRVVRRMFANNSPQPAAASACPGLFLPGPAGTRTAIWRHKTLLRVYLIDTKLIGCYKACKKNVRE